MGKTKRLNVCCLKDLSTYITIALFSLTFVSFLFLTSNSSFAESSLASVTVSSACTMTSTINSEHAAEITNGTFKEDIGKTALKVICNDAEGFSIYAVGYTDDEYGNNKLIEQSSTTSNIITGTATSGDTSNWAMKLTSVSGSSAPTIENGYNAYKEVPDKYVKVATFDAVTNITSGSSVETTYRAYVSRTQLAGTYNGKVKYTMVHPASAEPNQPKDCRTTIGSGTLYVICYWPNGDGEVVDSMGDQNVGALAQYNHLWASNYKRKGYGFAGWSDKWDWVLNENDENGNGTGPNTGYHIYGPNQDDIEVEAGVGLSLYAVWVRSAGYLQDWNQCSLMKVGEVTALTDKRDNDTYAVAKLKDGNCWMIENLRLDSEHTVGDYYESLAQGYAKSTTYGDFIGLAESESTGFSTTTLANSLYYSGTQSGTAIINVGTSNVPGERIPRYNNINTRSSVSQMTNYDSNVYGYGNYYNWMAAIANTAYRNSWDDTNTSICPSGWRLPSGGNNGDYWKLGVGIMGFEPTNGYNGAEYKNETNAENKTALKAFMSFPNNFVAASFYNNSGVGGRGGDGMSYWTSNGYYNGYYDGIAAYYLSGGVGTIHPGTGSLRDYYGMSVRCLIQGS